FLKTASEGFNPDPKYGPADIPELREAAIEVLARIFDTLSRRGDWSSAIGWWRAAQDQGFLQTRPRERNYRFEWLARMVETAANSAPGQPPTSRGGPAAGK